jgi:hypothetical protein
MQPRLALPCKKPSIIRFLWRGLVTEFLTVHPILYRTERLPLARFLGKNGIDARFSNGPYRMSLPAPHQPEFST